MSPARPTKGEPRAALALLLVLLGGCTYEDKVKAHNSAADHVECAAKGGVQNQPFNGYPVCYKIHVDSVIPMTGPRLPLMPRPE